MNTVIYNPLEEYENKYKKIHHDNTMAFFDQIVKQANINIEKNRKTVKKYNFYMENLKCYKKKLKKYKVYRVLMCISIILLPFVFTKINPSIKNITLEISELDKKSMQLLDIAKQQMEPLNALFTFEDALHIIEKTIPCISFDSHYTVDQELNMKINYDFNEENDQENDQEQSTLDTLSGSYNENPFLFENVVLHQIKDETYNGTTTIHWTEDHFDSNGHMHTMSYSQVLSASVVKPKPYYKKKIVLNYGSQMAPNLCFSRYASHVEQKSDKALKRKIKRDTKKLKKLTDHAVSNNQDFISMSNTEFEVLFNALDRTNEIEFRTLFSPIAQTNMTDLLLSKLEYGDDFEFLKNKRMNKIISEHSQERNLLIGPCDFASYSFDIIQEKFLKENEKYFKMLFFDFAPLLAITVYQERPIHSLKPIPGTEQRYSDKEMEVLVNLIDDKYVLDPQTKTPAILKVKYMNTDGYSDSIHITSYSYDIDRCVDYVSVYGRDGEYHDVPVEWLDYIPLKKENDFYIRKYDQSVEPSQILAMKNGICITKK